MYNTRIMSKKILKQLYKHIGTWHGVAKELDISYSYICMIKRDGGILPGKRLSRDIIALAKKYENYYETNH
jgi:hypothetical protein